MSDADFPLEIRIPITIPAQSVGATQMTSGEEAEGRILQSDGEGGVEWGDAPSGGGAPGVYNVTAANWWVAAPSGSEVEGECIFLAATAAENALSLGVRGAAGWTYINPTTATQAVTVKVGGANAIELRLDVVANAWAVSAGSFIMVKDATSTSPPGGAAAGRAFYVNGAGSGQWSGFDRKVVIAHSASPGSGSDWTALATDYPLTMYDTDYTAVRARVNDSGALINLN